MPNVWAGESLATRHVRDEVVVVNPSFSTQQREAGPLFLHHALIPVDTDDLEGLIRVLIRLGPELAVHGVDAVDPSVGPGRGVEEIAGEDLSDVPRGPVRREVDLEGSRENGQDEVSHEYTIDQETLPLGLDRPRH